MEFSERTNIVISRLAEAISDAIGDFMCEDYQDWQNYIVCVDNDLNVMVKYAQEAVEDGTYDISLHLDKFVFTDDDEWSVDTSACFEYAEKFGSIIEFSGIK